MNGRPSAVLFDLDGVLIRSEETWFRVLQEAAERFGGKTITREAFFPTFGQGTSADVETFGLSCTTEELDRFYAESFPRHLDGTLWVDPDAAGVLEQLAEAGIARAVVTNTVTALATVLLERAQLSSYFQVIACADQVPRAKPAPDLLLHALRGLGRDATQATMVGDSRFDREAARAANVSFVGVRLDGARRIERLSELPEVLIRA